MPESETTTRRWEGFGFDFDFDWTLADLDFDFAGALTEELMVIWHDKKVCGKLWRRRTLINFLGDDR